MIDTFEHTVALDLEPYWEDESIATLSLVNLSARPLVNIKGTLTLEPMTGKPDTREILLTLLMPGQRMSVIIEPHHFEKARFKGGAVGAQDFEATCLPAATWRGYQEAGLIADNRERKFYEQAKLAAAQTVETENLVGAIRAAAHATPYIDRLQRGWQRKVFRAKNVVRRKRAQYGHRLRRRMGL